MSNERQPGIEHEPLARTSDASGNSQPGTGKDRLSSIKTPMATRLVDPATPHTTESFVSPTSPSGASSIPGADQQVASGAAATAGWKGPEWRGGSAAVSSPVAQTASYPSPPTQYGYPSRIRYGSEPDAQMGGGYRYSEQQQHQQQQQQQQTEPLRRDKWWYAICSWGNELDDGTDGQAGRTNPFE